MKPEKGEAVQRRRDTDPHLSTYTTTTPLLIGFSPRPVAGGQSFIGHYHRTEERELEANLSPSFPKLLGKSLEQ